MRTRLETAVMEPESKDKCCHHWLIDRPDGPSSKGICKICGVEREFKNTLPQYGLRRKSTLWNRRNPLLKYPRTQVEVV